MAMSGQTLRHRTAEVAYCIKSNHRQTVFAGKCFLPALLFSVVSLSSSLAWCTGGSGGSLLVANDVLAATDGPAFAVCSRDSDWVLSCIKVVVSELVCVDVHVCSC